MMLLAASAGGGYGYVAPVTYSGAASMTLIGPDGLYTVSVTVTDVAGNATVLMQTIRLDTVGPTITYSMTAPTNGTSYDVGTTITFNFSATSPDNVVSQSATLDSTLALTNGQVINVNNLNAGTHTIVIVATNQLGSSSTTTITFQVHATVGGMINAVNQGAQAGFINALAQPRLVSILQSVQTYLNAGSVTAAKNQLTYFVSYVQSQSGVGINATYAARLINWANDLKSRL
jgi:hypothetical protein